MKKQYNVYVIKQMVNAIACTIELWMHLGGLLSNQEARVALDRLSPRVTLMFLSCLATSRVGFYGFTAMAFTIC